MSFLVPFLLSLAGCIILFVLLRKQKKYFLLEGENFKNEIQHEQQQSKDQKAEQTTILDALTEGLLIVNKETEIIFANKTVRELFRNRAIIDQSVHKVFFDDEIASIIIEAITTNTSKSKYVLLSFRANSPFSGKDDKSDSYWLIDISPIESPRKDILYRVILRDETSQYQTEQIRKDFVANASHELRTPLAIIEGYIENLLEDDIITESPNTARKFLEIMQRHSSRISRITEDMLLISRLESGEAATLNKTVFTIGECIFDVVERLESVIRKQGATVRVLLQDEEMLIEADRFYITQVLFNLIENALKQNATIPVQVAVRCHEEEDYLVISVEDDGIGIPSADLSHIFRRFYRVQKHHSQNEIKGTGLGLSIVKRAIEAHSGEISVTSISGLSTIFKIQLPGSIIKPTDYTEPPDPLKPEETDNTHTEPQHSNDSKVRSDL